MSLISLSSSHCLHLAVVDSFCFRKALCKYLHCGVTEQGDILRSWKNGSLCQLNLAHHKQGKMLGHIINCKSEKLDFLHSVGYFVHLFLH